MFECYILLLQLTYHFLILFFLQRRRGMQPHSSTPVYPCRHYREEKRWPNSSTSKECLWNRPRSRKLSPRKAEQLVFKKKKFSQTPASDSKPELQKPTVTARKEDISRFGQKLKSCNPHAAFLLCNEETVNMFQQPVHHQKTKQFCSAGINQIPHLCTTTV